MYGRMKDDLQKELAGIREAGLYKEERQITSPQAADISVVFPEGSPKQEVINFCANNYLGLSSHPKVIQAAHDALETHGYGMSSVRFICGTQDIHRRPRSMPMADSSNPCSVRTTRSSLISSTMRRSSTASASARPSGSSTRTMTWPTSRPSCARPKITGTG